MIVGTVNFDYWLDDVLSSVATAENTFVLHHIREAAIDFCEQSFAWKEDALPINVIAGQRQYLLDAPYKNTEIVRVEQAFVNGREISVTSTSGLSQQNINFMNTKGKPTCYTQEYTERMSLYPMPDSNLVAGLLYSLSLRPSRVAEGMNDSIGKRYFQAIAHGAKARLFEIPSKPWSDGALSTYHRAKFEMMARQARDEVASGLGRGPKRVVSHY